MNFALAGDKKLDELICEMADLSAQAKRGRDPVEHIMASWQPGDLPTIAQMREAVTIILELLGLSHCQVVWGVHADREHLHVHLAVNRVDPFTFRMLSAGYNRLYKEALAKAAAKICFVQAWEPEAAASYTYDGKRFLKTIQSDIPQISPEATRYEHETGRSSDQRRAQDAFANVDLTGATTWAATHEALWRVGLSYERWKSGAIIRLGDGATVKASSVARSLSLPKMEARIGNEFSPRSGAYARPDITGIRERHRDAARASGFESGPATLRVEPRDVLCQLPARDLAGGDGRSQRLLHGDHEVDPRLAIGLRQPPGAGSEPDLIPPPLRQIHAEYLREKFDGREARRKRRVELQARHQKEREALADAQRQERKEALSDDWKGMGTALNALRAALAATQREKTNLLKDRQKMERDAMPRAESDLAFADWLRARGRGDDAKLLQEWQAAPAIDFVPAKTPEMIDRTAEALLPEMASFEIVSQDGTSPVIWAAREAARKYIHIVDAGDKLTLRSALPDRTRWNDQAALAAVLKLAERRGGAVKVEAPPRVSKALLARVIPLAAATGVRLADPALERQRKELIAGTKLLNDPPPTAIQAAFDSYHAAVGAEGYRITSTKFLADGDSKGFNWSANELGLDQAPPGIVRANVSRRADQVDENVYYTPISTDRWHPQVDDMTADTLAEMKRAGYRECPAGC
jgi:hypothetical protein